MKQVSAAEFQAVRKTLIDNQLVSKTVDLRSIEITSDSLSRGAIILAGSEIKCTAGFFTSLARLLKMSSALTNELLKNGDTKIAAAMIGALRDYRAQALTKEIVVVADPVDKKLVSIEDRSKLKLFSAEGLCDLTQNLLTDMPFLHLESINQTGHGVKFNFLNDVEVGFASAGPDEFFKFGFTITQTHKQTIVEGYNQRLVCTNGLTYNLGSDSTRDIKFNDNFKLDGQSPAEIKSFLQKIEDMKRVDFVNPLFEKTINKASTTRASLAEVERAAQVAVRHLAEKDETIRKAQQDALTRNFFPGLQTCYNRLEQKGVDPSKLKDEHKQYIKTGQTVWDVVNSLTFLGSNDSGIDMNHSSNLKTVGGQLFAKGCTGQWDQQFMDFAKL